MYILRYMAGRPRRKTSDAVAKRFAQALFIDDNAANAAIVIGHDPKSAKMFGMRMKNDPRVIAEIARMREEEHYKTLFTKERIIKELMSCAFGTLDSVAKWGVRGLEFFESNKLTKEALSMIDEVSQNNTGALKIKRADKMKALELLGKELGMFQTNAVGTKDNPICVNNLSTRSDAELLSIVNGDKTDDAGTH